MKLTIEVEDKEEFLAALGNALYLYNDLSFTALLNLELPERFEKMLMDKVGPDPDVRYAFLTKRVNMLKDVYYQIDEKKGD